MLAAGASLPARAAGRRLRVALDAHTVGRQQTGNERYVLELARALARRDDVEVAAYVDRGVSWPAEYAPPPRLIELRTRTPQLRIPLELPYRARRDAVDLLQVTYVAPPLAGLPLVTVVHDMSFEDRPDFFALPTRLRLQSLVRLSVRRSAAVIAISNFTRGRLIDAYRLATRKVHAIHPGVGSQWRQPEPDATRSRLAPYRLPAQFALTVGTSHRRKNLPRVVDAVRVLRAAGHPGLELVICGPSGADDRALQQAIAIAGAESWVHRLGYVTDDVLRALYATAGVVVYASLYEGFGLPVLEALACGAVVVASSTTGVAEACGDACVTVDPSETALIAEGIDRALSDESLRADVRRRAPGHLARFTWDRSAEQTVAIYRSMLVSRRQNGVAGR